MHRRLPPSLGSRLSAVRATPAGSASASRRGRVSTSGAANTASAVETLVAIGSAQDIAEPLRPGRNFSFQLTFTNPLYEAVEVLVELLDPSEEEEEDNEQYQDSTLRKAGTERPIHWNVSMPGPSFGINATAEEWEYEDEDDNDENDAGLDSATVAFSAARRRKWGPGVLAKKGNKTVVQLDLAIGREASGEVRVPLYITYTYTAEEPLASENAIKANKSKQASTQNTDATPATAPPGASVDEYATSNVKSFSFWANIPLGRVVPRAGGGGSTLSVEQPEARRVPSSSNLR